MKLAAPTEDSGWTRPEPIHDRLTMDLPFTFSRNESMAVLEFLNRFFRDHGEGGAGRFSAAEPLLQIIEHQKEETFELIPALRTTWRLTPERNGRRNNVQIDSRMKILLLRQGPE